MTPSRHGTGEYSWVPGNREGLKLKWFDRSNYFIIKDLGIGAGVPI